MRHIFFHSADLDGHCSGAIAKFRFPYAELHGINYGEEFPWDQIDVENDTVIMVDFCLQPFSEMIKLYIKFGDRFIWIDHHISAIKDSKDHNHDQLIQGNRQNDKAACELTWEHFFPERELPEVVRLLGRYDVWDHTDTNVLPFQMGFRLENTWPDNQDVWQNYFHKESDELIKDTINDGKLILKYQKQENKKYAKSCAFEVKFEGYRAICINKMLTNSQLFDSIYDQNVHDIMITFGLRKNGLWTMSFYSTKEDVDCSVIAKKFGGGGHKGAAGASFNKLPTKFTKQIKLLQPIRYEPIPNFGDKMTIDDFKNMSNYGVIVDSDGHGYYATEDKITNLSVKPSDYFSRSIDKRFSHVIWFNR